jgi:hypothetical protein
MYCLCVNVYCHRVTTQLQLTNILYLARYLPFVIINNLTIFEYKCTTKNELSTLQLQRQTKKTWNTEKGSQFSDTIQGKVFFPEYKFKTLNDATN